MNTVILIGRLTKDPETRYTPSQTAVTTFTLAVDRRTAEKTADFIRITTFGKTAENCDRYLSKGLLTAVRGRIQTGSYKDKRGQTVYTTDVVADDVMFIEWGDKKKEPAQIEKQESIATPKGYAAIDEEIPF